MAPDLFPSQVASTLDIIVEKFQRSEPDQALYKLVGFVRLPAAIKLIHLGSRHGRRNLEGTADSV